MTVEVIHAGLLAALPHGFLGRRGGVSTGIVAGLNVGSGSGDDPAAVARNVRLAIDSVLPGAAAGAGLSGSFGHGGHRPALADGGATRRPMRW